MDRRHFLILANDKDVTDRVIGFSFDSGKCCLMFSDGHEYRYSPENVRIIREPRILDPEQTRVYSDGHEIWGVSWISEFRADGISVLYAETHKGMHLVTRKYRLVESALSDTEAGNVFSYLTALSEMNGIKTEDGEQLLSRYYRSISFIDPDSILASYLRPETHQGKTADPGFLIFPFGINRSQLLAVQRAFSNKLSIIQGPPGTGKTQTILTLIANIIIRGQCAEIISNNRSAVINVLEKLDRSGLSFIAALLGSAESKEAFLASQTGCYPDDLNDWKLSGISADALQRKIRSLSEEIQKGFTVSEELHEKKAARESLLTEAKHFTEAVPLERKAGPRAGTGNILKHMRRAAAEIEKKGHLGFIVRLQLMFSGLVPWHQSGVAAESVIPYLSSLYYENSLRSLEEDISRLASSLESLRLDDKISELTDLSMSYLKDFLFRKYYGNGSRAVFTAEDFWRNPDRVTGEYPVILSTAFSAYTALRGKMYDYVIMDEASQSDITVGALAMAGAGNAVVVGDLQQLPNVLGKEEEDEGARLLSEAGLPESYSCSCSFLLSVSRLFPSVPDTLLREHYRCHPKIIGFCNEKFYNNELLIMTEDNGEKDAMTFIRTPAVRFAHGHTNQRQADVIAAEVLPGIGDIPPDDIGIITPYRDNAALIRKETEERIETSTVHSFQGREKDAIIFATSDDVVTSFSDDPNLINVAVSRAKKHFVLVASSFPQPRNSTIGDLEAYIAYNDFRVLDSRVASVFDILFSDATKERLSGSGTRVSEYDSENLMYEAIIDVIGRHFSLNLRTVCHYPLRYLIRDFSILDEEEKAYAGHISAHVDFLIYRFIGKVPVLAIEVDGFSYHKPGSRQAVRDHMKDSILMKAGIPLMRFSTAGSGECARLEKFFSDYEKL